MPARLRQPAESRRELRSGNRRLTEERRRIPRGPAAGHDPATRGHALLEVADEHCPHPIAAPPGVTVSWLPRSGGRHGSRLIPAVLDVLPGAEAGGAAGFGAAVARTGTGVAQTAIAVGRTGIAVPETGVTERAVACAAPTETDDELWETPELDVDDLYVWLAGEAGTMRTLRRHLIDDVGLRRSSMSVMGYWRRGKAEHNA